ncbi:MAG: Uma2 family endonuclease [Fimbriimonadales bacterium]|nr:Uma2 family endonuclease [Fimbriimonadales bacterium]
MPKTATAAKPRTRRKTASRAENPQLAELQEMIEYLQNLDLPEEDGVPLETDYHRVQIALLDEVVRQLLGDTNDYFCGGNMFIYYSLEQANDVQEYVAGRKREPMYKGPDFFLVRDVDGSKPRGKWEVWKEGGRYPDLIVEIVSPSTKAKDENENKMLYARVFHTPEYFLYDQWTRELKGYRLAGRDYEPIQPDAQGRLWSQVLGAYLGIWHGQYRGRVYHWLRLYHENGELVPTVDEIAERERQRAEQERQRAEQERRQREEAERRIAELEAELRRLRGEATE